MQAEVTVHYFMGTARTRYFIIYSEPVVGYRLKTGNCLGYHLKTGNLDFLNFFRSQHWKRGEAGVDCTKYTNASLDKPPLVSVRE